MPRLPMPCAKLRLTTTNLYPESNVVSFRVAKSLLPRVLPQAQQSGPFLKGFVYYLATEKL
ncbi:hypothetical protein PanWU01x14_237950, partial [Parasponia andersonii]